MKSVLNIIGNTHAEADTPILEPRDSKNWLSRKDPDARKDWREGEKGTTEDEKVGCHHRFNGRGFGWTPGVGDEQGCLCAAVHGVAKSQTWLSDWTEVFLIKKYFICEKNFQVAQVKLPNKLFDHVKGVKLGKIDTPFLIFKLKHVCEIGHKFSECLLWRSDDNIASPWIWAGSVSALTSNGGNDE